MSMFTIEQLKSLFPRVEGAFSEEVEIKEVYTDSRMEVEKGLFVPIIGENFDAHTFIEGAVEHGAIATLWDESIPVPTHLKDSIMFFIVDDTIEGLQKLATAYRKKVNPIVVGVTGSNGKTSTKDLLKTVLQQKYRTYGTVGNFNNHIGLPLTILQMEQGTEMLILEMGMSDFKEIETLSNISLPDYAIITNIGESHIEHLGSREGIAKAKLEIKAGLKEGCLLIIDGDEVLMEKEHEQEHVLSCGFTQTNEYIVTNVDITEEETKFFVNDVPFTIPLVGKHHAQNASFVFALAKHLHMSDEQIQAGFSALQYSNMRFERLVGKNGVRLINDAYNDSPTSMKAAIEVMKQLKDNKRKIIVLGDILELGPYTEDLHRSIAEVIDEQIDHTLLFGESMRYLYDVLQQKGSVKHVDYFKTKDAIIQKLETYTSSDTTILFKASRGMAFEQIVEALK